MKPCITHHPNAPARTGRAGAGLVCVLAAALWLAGCASPAPPPQLYHLRSAPPLTTSAAPAPSPWIWQLATPLRVPDYLDRDALLVPQGQAGLAALPGHRWAEPLRDSVPRVLRHDLGLLLGETRVWAAPVPAGVVATRQLRIELLALEADSERRHVLVRARWAITDPTGAAAARVELASLAVPSGGTDPDSLVAAHRLALWQLAERIAASTR